MPVDRPTADRSSDRFTRAVERASRRPPLARRLANRVLRLLPQRAQRLLRRKRIGPVGRALRDFARSHADVTFVQIGSCDGTTGDPLYEHIVKRGWSGVVVEPVPANFRRLRESYRGFDRIRCENVAISDREQVRPFYHVEAPGRDVPEWCHQIGSFDRDHLVKHSIMWPEVESYIVETEVRCITLPQLLERSGIERVDLLHTDVEGFDLHILRQIDFRRHRPELILYEDLHMGDDERDEAAELMRAAGYAVISDGMNALAQRA